MAIDFQVVVLKALKYFKILYLQASSTYATTLTATMQLFFAGTSADVVVTGLLADTQDREVQGVGFLHPLGDMSPVLVTTRKSCHWYAADVVVKGLLEGTPDRQVQLQGIGFLQP